MVTDLWLNQINDNNVVTTIHDDKFFICRINGTFYIKFEINECLVARNLLTNVQRMNIRMLQHLFMP